MLTEQCKITHLKHSTLIINQGGTVAHHGLKLCNVMVGGIVGVRLWYGPMKSMRTAKL